MQMDSRHSIRDSTLNFSSEDISKLMRISWGTRHLDMNTTHCQLAQNHRYIAKRIWGELL